MTSLEISISEKRLRELLDERDEEIIQLKAELAMLRFGGDAVDVEFRSKFPILADTLQPQEFRMLKFLYAQRPRMLRKETILNAVYPHGVKDSHEYPLKTIDVYVCRLRKAISQAGADIFIATDWGRGYGVIEISEIEKLAFRVLEVAGYPRNSRNGTYLKLKAILENEYVSDDLTTNQKLTWPRIESAVRLLTGREIIKEAGRIWLAPEKN